MCLRLRRLYHRAGVLGASDWSLCLRDRREAIVLLLMCQGRLLVSWLLAAEGGLSGFHVAICAGGLGVLLPTFAVRCGKTRCPLRTVGFG